MYRRLLRSVGVKIAGAAAATAVLQAGALLTPLVVANAVASRGLSLWTVLTVTAIAGAAFVVATAARGRLVLSVKLAHDARVTTDLVRHVLGLDLSYFHTRSSADLMSRLTSTSSIRDALSTIAVTSAVDAAAAVLFLTGLFIVNPAVATLGIAVSVVLLAGPVVAYHWTRVHSLTLLERRSAGGAKLIMMLLGIEQAKAHAAERALASEWRDTYEAELDATRRAGRIDNWAQTVITTCRLLAAPLLVVVAQATTGSTVQAIGFGLAAGAFLGPVGNLTATITGVMATYAHLMRIEDILDETADDIDAERVRTRGPALIALDKVSYTYPGASRCSVDDVTLTIPPYCTIVIVGESGSGKSTLARLIAGLVRPTSGHVRFTDTEGAPCVPKLGYVAQAVALYPGTVRSNITFGRVASDDDVNAAVEAAGLTRFVTSLNMGLGTRVLDSGQAFSGGQRQRIAIARALLEAPPVVIFDEATSNLDPASEDHVLDAISRMACTKILVAHGPKSLRLADMVVHMKDGCITAVDRRTASAPDLEAHTPGAESIDVEAVIASGEQEPTGRLRLA